MSARGDSYCAGQTEIDRLEVAAQLAIAQGDSAQARALLTRAAEMEDVTELASITPGPFLPAREMLGDLLLALQAPQPAQAWAQFRATLAKQANRLHSLHGAALAAR